MISARNQTEYLSGSDNNELTFANFQLKLATLIQNLKFGKAIQSLHYPPQVHISDFNEVKKLSKAF